MRRASNKIADLSTDQRDVIELLQMPSTDDHHHLQLLTQSTPSMISFENVSVPPSIFNILSSVYSDRTHRRCMHVSYITLLVMVLAVIGWMAYWLFDNHCGNLHDTESDHLLCDLSVVFEVFTFAFVGASPLLMILTIYAWARYACYNPFDSIRENFVGFKIEGEQWRRQLDFYYHKKKSRYLNCLRCKQRRELADRGYGYIILSPHGLVIDELLLFATRRVFIDSGSVSTDGKMLEITLKRSCRWPWKNRVDVYLSDEIAQRRSMEELAGLLKVPINSDTLLPPCV